ncbi:zinc finger protein 639-like isoform X3 [Hyalella azteca]|uniref:Zinc finger protein 639-like isoform X3 n=1 Tax=Hyalella azteca TaxID=294128 RepID=A0A979FNG4_HYAAZ|nr:zinc finger protein 639-like isoform X3 [Hyalella azteca]
MAYSIKECRVVLHQLSDAAVRSGCCPEQSLIQAATDVCKLEPEVYIKEEPEDEGEDITVKEEPLCSEEYEQTPLPSSCKPCKKEFQVEAHEACTSTSQYTAAVPHMQDSPCNAQGNIGQDEWMSVYPETKGKEMSASEKNIYLGPNSAGAVQEVLFDQPASEFKSLEHNLTNNDHARLTKKLHKVSSSTDSLHSKVLSNAHQIDEHNFETKLKCGLCDYVASVKKYLQRHLFSKHGLGEGFKCKLCDYETGLQELLKKHLFSKHGLGEGFKCKLCDYETGRQEHLKKHIFSKHSLGEGFKCKLCDYETGRQERLKKHMFSKHGLGGKIQMQVA